ncbi:MAG: CoA transferase [Dehalococcoidia bacterium]|nr:CoA transferase [Dehalococcoidia bacterium]
MTNGGGAESALGHLRVVEIGEIPAAYCAGYLAGLGADVVKVEPPGGDPNRMHAPFAGDIADPERSIPFLNANLNRRSIVLDVEDAGGKETLEKLIERADIFVECTPPGYLASLGVDNERLEALNSGLVTVSLTPFGQSGPHSAFAANEAVISAMSGVMMSQGDDTMSPVVLPCQIGAQLAAALGAYLGVNGVRHRRATGRGQRIDLSLQEALTFATVGTIARYSQRSELVTRQGPRGGPANIYRTKDDKYVQIAVFMTGHWRVLARQWMEDAVLSGDDWDSSQYRTDNEDLAQILIQSFVEQFDRDEFVEEGQKRGLAVCPVNTFEDFVTDEHMRSRGWFQAVTHPVVGEYETPGQPFIMSATPWNQTRPAPLLDQHRDEVLAEIESVQPRRDTYPAPTNGKAPDDALLDGIRVADITRAFAGPIGTMFLGFYGAEVIKVESESLEANREPTRPLFPDMNRNKISCTLDLRSDGGKDLFRQLVKDSDVVVDNFSATVMKRLGLGYDDLTKINPGIIQIGMPGMGSEGPLNNWVTYGNNLQAVTGLSLLWGHPDSPMQNHAKGVIPDYVGAAFVALSTAAALEFRDVTGRGQFIEIAQVDGQGSMMGPAILDYTINKNIWGSVGYDEPINAHYAPYGAYACLYPDTWIVIACETDEQWRALSTAMGAPHWADDPRFANAAGRRENRDEIDHEISEWAKGFTSHQLLHMLQKVGVPAGVAMNSEDLYHDPHLRERGHIVQSTHSTWGTLSHHGLPAIPSLSRATAANRAPWIGEDNEYVFTSVLGLSEDQIREGTESGVLK